MQMYGNFEGIPVNSALFGLEINNDPCMNIQFVLVLFIQKEDDLGHDWSIDCLRLPRILKHRYVILDRQELAEELDPLLSFEAWKSRLLQIHAAV